MDKQITPRPNNWSKLFLADAAEIPDDLDWESLDRLCPATLGPPRDEWLTQERVEEVRQALRRGVHPADDEQAWRFMLGQVIIDGLRLSRLPKVKAPSGWLYVLEAQGPVQYIKFGRGQNPLRRLMSHQREAKRHGFGLLNAWVSPPLPDAGHAEGVALVLGRKLQHTGHEGERFYDMPFPKALTVARVAAETALLAIEGAVEVG